MVMGRTAEACLGPHGGRPGVVRSPAGAKPAIRLLACLTLYNEPAISLATSLRALAQTCALLPDPARQPHPQPAPAIVLAVIADGEQALAPCTRALLDHLALRRPGPTTAPAPLIEGWAGQFAGRTLTTAELMGGCAAWLATGAAWREPGATETAPEAEAANGAARPCIALELQVWIKPANAGKLDSHALFFGQLCPALQPEFCVQMDAGTAPEPDCLPRLLSELAARPCCAASFPSITAECSGAGALVSFQHYDYLMSNGLRWSLQALCGYAEVIPGQFCLLRWSALQLGNPPLVERYLDTTESNRPLGALILLTEDRKLALDLRRLSLACPEAQISHVVDAIAVTDACQSWAELVQQRRRWLNGSAGVNLATLRTWVGEWRSARRPGQEMLRWNAAAADSLLALVGYWMGGALPLVLTVVLGALLSDPACSLASWACGAGRLMALAAAGLWVLQLWLLAELQHHRHWAVLLDCGHRIQVPVVLGVLVLVGARGPAGLIAVGMLLLACLAADLAARTWTSRAAGGIPSWRVSLCWPLLLPVLRSSLCVYALAHLGDLSWGTKGLAQPSRADRPGLSRRLRRRITAGGLVLLWLALVSINLGWPSGWLAAAVAAMVAALAALGLMGLGSPGKRWAGTGWSAPWLIWPPATAALLLVLHQLQEHQLLLRLVTPLCLGLAAWILLSAAASQLRRRQLRRRRGGPAPAGPEVQAMAGQPQPAP